MSTIATNKQELLLAIDNIYVKLMADYHMIHKSKSRVIGIKGNIKGTYISVSDTVAYLIGWGQLVLKWHQLKSSNQNVAFPESGYKWNQLGLLAESFQNKYRSWHYDDLLNELDSTVDEIRVLINQLSEHALYGSNWYEKWTLGRMIQLNTASPMKNIRTKIRKFNREFNGKIPQRPF